jgi:enoyl-CoA hydratase/carnithine racemase
MQLTTDKIIAEKDGAIGWLVFNNPERRNAVSLEMWESVQIALDAYDGDDAIRVVVVRGAGDKAFASGADISQFEEKRNNAEAAEAYARISQAARDRMGRLSKPLIAMIRGFCMGGGLGVAVKADIRIASEDAQFGIPAARLGLAYAFESLKTLSDLVGPSFAKEILFTARRFTAEEALRIGLVNRVVAGDQLEATVREYAAMIAENAPLTIRASKLSLTEVVKDPDKRDLAAIETLNRLCMDSEDYAEGRRAFMEKRKPRFVGR